MNEPSIVDVICTVASMRGMMDWEVANEMTYSHLFKIYGAHVKDQFMVASTLINSFSGISNVKSGEVNQFETSRKGGLPSWYHFKPQPGRAKQTLQPNVVDLDGPMNALRPYVGGGVGKRGKSRKFPRGKGRK